MWDEGLLDEQKTAASHCGSHACLLAGPGTGKTRTLQRHVVFLINQKNVPPNQILALTFTRAAAFELRKRIAEIIGEEHALPRVSTIHSFALRQILKNADIIQSIPKPLRIADDWEERNIIYEDLKDILSSDIKTISKTFKQLSADWQTLDAEKERWEERFPDSTFIGAWRQHRKIYGYTLRDELVYQLKRSLEQTDNFSLESDYLHLLVDEYQDLNRCDMGIVFALRDRGMEVYAAGDDDQSIYGFRYALPKGIRRFNEDFDPSQFLTLKICIRCDKNIIRLATFVANLDPSRIKKPLNPMPDASTGAVHILRFGDQDNEAKGIATICNYLIKKKGIPPNEIFILTRSDRHGLFSSNIRDALVSRDLPVTVPDTDSILDSDEGRFFIALLNLLENPEDNLALRTILHIERNRIGKKSYAKIFELANQEGITFSQAAYKIQRDPNLIPRDGKKIAGAIDFINKKISIHTKMIELFERSVDRDEIFESLIHFVEDIIPDSENKSKLTKYIKTVMDETDPSDFKNLIQILSATVNEIEQALDPEKINIMTMHKAKGLTATAVILAACEDEYIPGRQTEEMEGDERRLLYVSLSRAKKFLYITYCNQRTGQQTHTGRSFGNAKRTLTRFLWDAPNKPLSGQKYVEKLKI